MEWNLLPRENLIPVSPDFTDRVMARIARYRRRERILRRAKLFGAAVLAIVLSYASVPAPLFEATPPAIARKAMPTTARREAPVMQEATKVAHHHVRKPKAISPAPVVTTATREPEPVVVPHKKPTTPPIALATDVQPLVDNTRSRIANCPPSPMLESINPAKAKQAAERCRRLEELLEAQKP